MYLLETDDESVFFAGDTALVETRTHLVERVLWKRGRELDLALLPIGYAPWWKPGFRRGHLTHDDALDAVRALRARVLRAVSLGHVSPRHRDGARRDQASCDAPRRHTIAAQRCASSSQASRSSCRRRRDMIVTDPAPSPGRKRAERRTNDRRDRDGAWARRARDRAPVRSGRARDRDAPSLDSLARDVPRTRTLSTVRDATGTSSTRSS